MKQERKTVCKERAESKREHRAVLRPNREPRITLRSNKDPRDTLRSNRGLSSHLVPLILLGEFFERFTYYTIRAVLFTYVVTRFGYSREEGVAYVHGFIFLSYSSCVLGGIISDGLFGAATTICLFLVTYILGALSLTGSAVVGSGRLLHLGTSLVSFSAGCMKPAVSSLGGGEAKREETDAFFTSLYFFINVSGAIAILVAPPLLSRSCFDLDTCYALPFSFSFFSILISLLLFLGISGVILFRRRVVPGRTTIRSKGEAVNNNGVIGGVRGAIELCSGKEPQYATLLCSGKEPHCVTQSCSTKKIYSEKELPCITHSCSSKEQPCTAHPPCVTQPHSGKSLITLALDLLPISIGWMVYDQQSTTWVDQGHRLEQEVSLIGYGLYISAAQIQALNSCMLIIILPFFSQVSSGLLRVLGLPGDQKARMVYGMAAFSLSFCVAFLLELSMRICNGISILAQVPQIFLLTIGEAFVGSAGLAFSYSEAPAAYKTIVLSFWYANMALGNLMVALLARIFQAYSVTPLSQALAYALLSTGGTIWMSMRWGKLEG